MQVVEDAVEKHVLTQVDTKIVAASVLKRAIDLMVEMGKL